MKRKNAKGGFTLWEMIIVLAVLAILSAVLIPTISNAIRKADINSDILTVEKLNDEVEFHNQYFGNITTEAELHNLLNDSEMDWEAPVSVKYGYHFWFNIEKQCFVLATVEGKPVSEVTDNSVTPAAEIYQLKSNVFRCAAKAQDSEQNGEEQTAALSLFTIPASADEESMTSGDTFYFVDQTGSALAEALTILDNPKTALDYQKAVDSLYAHAQDEFDGKAFQNVYVKIESTVVIADFGIIKPEATTEQVFFTGSVTEESDYSYAIGTERYYVHDGKITVDSTDLSEYTISVQQGLIIALPEKVNSLSNLGFSFAPYWPVLIITGEIGEWINDIDLDAFYQAYDEFGLLTKRFESHDNLIEYFYPKEEPIEEPSPIKTLFENHSDYIYRVGNQNPISLNSLFYVDSEEAEQLEIDNVEVVPISGASGTYNTEKSELEFAGIGIVKVIAYAGTYKSNELFLEVIDATNVKSGSEINSAIQNDSDAVMIADCGDIYYSKITINNGHTLYGNGFTISSSYIGYGLANYMATGFIELYNGNLDNVKIVCAIYPRGYLFISSSQLGESLKDSNNVNTKFSSQNGSYYNYQYNAVAVNGKCNISNCYIKGARNNIYVNNDADGSVIYNTTLAYGALANMYIAATSGTIVLKDLTTVQDIVKTDLSEATLSAQGANDGDADRSIFGFTVLVGNDESSSYPTIQLEGTFNQHNWIKKGTTTSSTITNKIINSVFNLNNEYVHDIDGEKYVNSGFVFMTTKTTHIVDNTSDSKNYKLSNISISGTTGQTYSFTGSADANSLNIPPYSYTENELDKRVEGTKLVSKNTAYCVKYEFDNEQKDMIPVIDAEIQLGESFQLAVKDIVARRTGIDYEGTSFVLNNERVESDYVISCDSSEQYVLVVSGKTDGYYNESGIFVNDGDDFTYSLKINVISAAIAPPVLTAKSTYNSNSNLFTSSTSGEHTIVAKALNDVEVTYYSKSRKSYVTIPLSLFTPSSNGKLDKTWTGTYDGCTLTIESTQAIHAGKSDYGYFVVYNGVMYLTNSNKVSSGSGARQARIKYTFTDNNAQTVTLDPGARTENRSTAQSTSSSSSKYITRLDPGAGTVTTSEYGPNSSGTTVNLETPKREAYIFLGWYDQPSGGTRQDNNGSYKTTKNNTVLYAQWVAAVKYVVSFDANDGETDTPSIDAYGMSEQTLPSATRDGYWLVGWYSAKEGGQLIGKAGAKYTHPLNKTTYFAHWSPIYTIKYNVSEDGTCDRTSDKYEGTSITLPTPTPKSDKSSFKGWFIGNTQVFSPYTPTADITLTAVWAKKITVTYDYNKGTGSPASESVAEGNSVTLPSPTLTGYDFKGWYDQQDGGTKQGDAGASYTPEADIPLYAQWTKHTYTIKQAYHANGATCKISSASGQYGDTITYTPTDSDGINAVYIYATNGGSTSNYYSKKSSVTSGTSYTFTMPDYDVTIYVDGKSGGCFSSDTLITMADGTQKAIENLSVGEMIQTFDFETGNISAQPILTMEVMENILSQHIKVSFSNGKSIEIITSQALFDADKREYFIIDSENAESFVGTNVLANGETISITEVETWMEESNTYEIITLDDFNFFAEGILTCEPYIFCTNIFEIDESFKYDQEKMQEDIEKYGLFTYDEVSEIVSEEEFAVFKGQYFKIAIGKGLYTLEQLVEASKIYHSTYEQIAD